jgi:hypothetical protein
MMVAQALRVPFFFYIALLSGTHSSVDPMVAIAATGDFLCPS